jgi:CCR4-NOT transcription complex subunit 9
MSASEIEQYVQQLSNAATRENALLELSKKRENFPELAPYLWYSFGTVAALLQEIVSIYPLLSPPSLTAHASNRVCNALALLQCVASHPETRGLFLQGVFVCARMRASLAWLLLLWGTTLPPPPAPPLLF